MLRVSLNRGGLTDVIEQLRRTPVGLDTMLGRLVPHGVAYHHAGERIHNVLELEYFFRM